MKKLMFAFVLITFACSCLMANSVTFVTPPNSVEPADLTHIVNAQADITTLDGGIVQITLTNLLTAAQMHDAGQLLSDLFFSLSGTFATGLVSNTNEDTPTGTLINVGAGGVVTSSATAVGKWGFSNTSNTFHIDDLNNGNSPTQTIIGGTAGSFTAYSGANSSITNGTHSPFVQGSEQFTLHIAGVTHTTNILSATFSFGTDSGGNIPGSPVPEPRTTALLMAGGALIALAFRRRQAKAL